MIDEAEPLYHDPHWDRTARELLAPFRGNLDLEVSDWDGIELGPERVEELIQAIIVALSESYLNGYSDGGLNATLDDRGGD